MSRRIYEKEFGWKWGVPQWIQEFVDKGSCEDTSWHNDVFPSFVFKCINNSKYALYINHIVKSENRDAEDSPRFMFYKGTLEDGNMEDEPYFTTDSEIDAFKHVLDLNLCSLREGDYA